MPSRGAEAVKACAANVVLIFGDVGEMREEAECADDLQRLARRRAVQRLRELATGCDILVAAEAHRALANALDDVEHGLAALLTHRVAEDTAEQPDVVAQRQVLVFGVDRR